MREACINADVFYELALKERRVGMASLDGVSRFPMTRLDHLISVAHATDTLSRNLTSADQEKTSQYGHYAGHCQGGRSLPYDRVEGAEEGRSRVP